MIHIKVQLLPGHYLPFAHMRIWYTLFAQFKQLHFFHSLPGFLFITVYFFSPLLVRIVFLQWWAHELLTISTYQQSFIAKNEILLPELTSKEMPFVGVVVTDVEQIDDMECSKHLDHNVKLLDRVCNKLMESGVIVYLLEGKQGSKETDWFVYWLIPVVLKSCKKKSVNVLKVGPPKNVKQLRGSIEVINYYRDMWSKRAHVLLSLTDAVGKCRNKNDKIKFGWTSEMNKAFKEIIFCLQMQLPFIQTIIHLFTYI